MSAIQTARPDFYPSQTATSQHKSTSRASFYWDRPLLPNLDGENACRIGSDTSIQTELKSTQKNVDWGFFNDMTRKECIVKDVKARFQWLVKQQWHTPETVYILNLWPHGDGMAG